MNMSEVATIRQQIDLEIAACKLAMTGYAQVSRHDVITHHFDALGGYLERLEDKIGSDEAIKILADALQQQL